MGVLSHLLCISFVIFRKLRHPGIVKYFGTCLLHETIGTTVKIVLELCDCSLRKLVTSHPENSPARLSKKPIRNKVLNWALQVLDALRYIHSEGFVHRDLKLDNLLVSYFLVGSVGLHLSTLRHI